jgi:hypothetical protein
MEPAYRYSVSLSKGGVKMTVKEFVGMCADRNMEVFITDGIRREVAKGNAMEVFTSNVHGELLKSEVDCFYCNGKRLYITLK